MKKYILDKIILLLFGLFSIVFFFWYLRECWLVLVPLTLLIIYIYTNKNLVFLPIDLIVGEKKEYMYFVSCSERIDNEIFNDTYYREFKFIYGGNNKEFLIIPEALTIEESYKSELPPTKVKLEVCYYKLSRVLISWKELEGEREVRYL